jgi:hypothetical protein
MNPSIHVETDPPPLMSQRLTPLFKQGFFRPLARPSAPVYVDFIDRFEIHWPLHLQRLHGKSQSPAVTAFLEILTS